MGACGASSAATAAKMAASNEFDLVAVGDVAAATQDLAASGAAAVAVDYRVCALNAAVFTTAALADDDYKVGAPNEDTSPTRGVARGAARGAPPSSPCRRCRCRGRDRRQDAGHGPREMTPRPRPTLKTRVERKT